LELSASFHQPPALPSITHIHEAEDPILYQPGIHGSAQNFERWRRNRSDYNRLIREVEADITQIKDFLQENNSPDTTGQLDRFLHQIKEGSQGWFSDVIGLFYNQGKQALDQIAALSIDDSIPLHKRLSELQRLPFDTAVCGPGVATNLVDIASNLNLGRPNMHAHAQAAWRELAKQSLIEFSGKKHGSENNYEAWETHYVTAYRNAVADLTHQPHSDDPFIRSLPRSIVENIAECRNIIQDRVDTKNLIRNLSQQCLQEVRDHFTEYNDSILTADEAHEIYSNYTNGFGSELKKEYGTIPFSTIFSPQNISPADRGEEWEEKYALTNNSAIIEADIIRNLQRSDFLTPVEPNELVTDPDTRQVVREVMDGFFVIDDAQSQNDAIQSPNDERSPERRPILPGDLAWIKTHRESLAQADLSRLAEASLRNLRDPRLYPHLRGDDIWSAVESAADNAPARFEILSGPELSQFKNINLNQYSLLEDRFALSLTPNNSSIFLENKAKDGEIRESLVENLLGKWQQVDPERQKDLLNTRDREGRSLLSWSMSNNHVQAIATILETQLAIGATRDDLIARDGAGRPVLVLAMEKGHAEAVTAYIEAIGGLPADSQARILSYTLRQEEEALLQAAVEQGLGEVLNERTAALEAALENATDRNGESGVFQALKNGHPDAIRAYADAIRHLDPAVQTRLLQTDIPEIPEQAGDEDNPHQKALQAYLDAISEVGQPRRAAQVRQSPEPAEFPLADNAGAMNIDEEEQVAVPLPGAWPDLDDASEVNAEAMNLVEEQQVAFRLPGAWEELSDAGEVELLPPLDADSLAEAEDITEAQAELAVPVPRGVVETQPDQNDAGEVASAQESDESLLNDEEAARLDAVIDRFEAEANVTGRAGAAPGLSLALEEGHAGTIRLYAEAIRPFAPAVQADLFEATTMDGTPALSLAVRNGHAAVIRAYAEAIQHLDTAARIRLLAAVDAELLEETQNTGTAAQREAVSAYLGAQAEALAGLEEAAHDRTDAEDGEFPLSADDEALFQAAAAQGLGETQPEQPVAEHVAQAPPVAEDGEFPLSADDEALFQAAAAQGLGETQPEQPVAEHVAQAPPVAEDGEFPLSADDEALFQAAAAQGLGETQPEQPVAEHVAQAPPVAEDGEFPLSADDEALFQAAAAQGLGETQPEQPVAEHVAQAPPVAEDGEFPLSADDEALFQAAAAQGLGETQPEQPVAEHVAQAPPVAEDGEFPLSADDEALFQAAAAQGLGETQPEQPVAEHVAQAPPVAEDGEFPLSADDEALFQAAAAQGLGETVTEAMAEPEVGRRADLSREPAETAHNGAAGQHEMGQAASTSQNVIAMRAETAPVRGLDDRGERNRANGRA